MNDAVLQHETIQATDFKPGGGQRGSRSSGRRVLLWLALLALLLLLAAAIWLFTGQSVRINIQPMAENVELEGSRWHLKLADRWLLHPGNYTVAAEVAGYHPLREAIAVDNQAEQSFEFVLRKLPGRLSVQADPSSAQGEVLIDGKSLGSLPLSEAVLEPGSYTLDVDAPKFKPFSVEVSIEGGDVAQLTTVQLEPAWADIAISTQPEGATVIVDGVVVGTTPLTAEIVEGEREVELSLAAHQSWYIDLEVVANQAQTLPPVLLKKADYQIRVVSTPRGAGVTVDGDYRGQTPINLKLPPDHQYRLGLSKAGYRPARRQLTVREGEVSDMSVRLEPILGSVELRGKPGDAEVLFDRVVQGNLNETYRLPARPHQLQVRKAGYQDYTATVTPSPDLPQRIEVALLTTQQVRNAGMPLMRNAANGYLLKLVRPNGVIRLGSPRREQGRKANEYLRKVRLQRPYYIGVHEVTNEQFLGFNAKHDSGVVERKTLSLKQQPVVRIDWQQAAAFCNWLSERDGLPPAYRNAGGSLQAVDPMTTGYRLPSEAEWALAGRYHGSSGLEGLRFPWGAEMPPANGSGNFAGTEAVGLTQRSLSNYVDDYSVSAPVGQFGADKLGLHDMGGNVREWMHDLYAIRAGAATTLVDPLGPEEGEGHLVRGSSWRSGSLGELRLAARSVSTQASDDLGFRVVRYAE